jgi:hypothetical protein
VFAEEIRAVRHTFDAILDTGADLREAQPQFVLVPKYLPQIGALRKRLLKRN